MESLELMRINISLSHFDLIDIVNETADEIAELDEE